MKNAMTDLETLGKVPGCTILSIGAVMFNSTHLGNEFHVVVSRASCADAGLVEDPGTLKWWSEQSAEARKVLDAAESAEAVPLRDALALFNAFIKENSPGVSVWGNGAAFDNAILNVAYAKVTLYPAWAFTNDACYRTLKRAKGAPKLRRMGTYHNALDDAKSQAQHVLDLIQWNSALALLLS